MKRHVVVHASSGDRVALEIHQFIAGGVKTEYAGSDGKAHFDLDVDTFAEATVYVNGDEKVGRGSIQDDYWI